ncbi:MAG: hypothetical protein JNK37_20490 [Verrucomicrobiales bacterium]|nr:hypothetical protein [Verrucomicrobiales bacterium]
MSLKHFHVLFIVLAALFCLAFGAWALLVAGQGAEVRGMGIFSIILGGILAYYGAYFFKKARRIIT